MICPLRGGGDEECGATDRSAGRRRDIVRVLVLGGTEEARRLAGALRGDGHEVTYALAGVTPRPRLPDGVDVRVGGFGGAAGLARWLVARGVDVLVDATHPFARRMQAHAAEAAAQAGISVLRLARPLWKPDVGDRWIEVENLEAAALVPSRGARVLASVGSRGLADFRRRGDLWLTARVMTPPVFSLPPRWRIIMGGPRRTVAAEAALLRALRCQLLICRNSGGAAGWPRVLAARLLGLPVVMARPPRPPAGVSVFHSAPALREALAAGAEALSCGGGALSFS
jgi:precorrin-6A/cobalt-precorrin-6A reductase